MNFVTVFNEHSLYGGFRLFQCVFEVDKENGLTLTELAEGVEVAEIVSSTGCEFQVYMSLPF
jgi:hypothetical protein